MWHLLSVPCPAPGGPSDGWCRNLRRGVGAFAVFSERNPVCSIPVEGTETAASSAIAEGVAVFCCSCRGVPPCECMGDVGFDVAFRGPARISQPRG
jgi:hypothetical protein